MARTPHWRRRSPPSRCWPGSRSAERRSRWVRPPASTGWLAQRRCGGGARRERHGARTGLPVAAGGGARPAGARAGRSLHQPSWNEQAVFGGAGPSDVARTAALARRRFGAAARSLEPLHSLADFCLAVRREVIEAIGGADEEYGIGPCWEMDYSIRAARAGFSGVWVGAAYAYRYPPTERRRLADARRMGRARRLYQDRFCGLRLNRLRVGLRGPLPGRGVRALRAALRCSACACRSPRPDLPGIGAPRPAGAASAARPPMPPRAVTRRPSPQPLLSWPALDAAGHRHYAHPPAAGFRAAGGALLPRPGLSRARSWWSSRTADRRWRGGCPMTRASVTSPPGRRPAASGPCVTRRVGWPVATSWPTGTTTTGTDPERLSRQVAAIRAGSADITALRDSLMLDLPTWRFWRCRPDLHRRLFVRDVHGGTLVYRRRGLGEPGTVSRRLAGRGRRLPRPGGATRRPAAGRRRGGHFIYVRHGANAWGFTCGVTGGVARLGGPARARPPARRAGILCRPLGSRPAAQQRPAGQLHHAHVRPPLLRPPGGPLLPAAGLSRPGS